MSTVTGAQYPFTLVYINDPADEDDEGVEQAYVFRNAADAREWTEGVEAIKTVHHFFQYCRGVHSVQYCKGVAKDFVRMTNNFGLQWEFKVPQDVMRQYQGMVDWIRTN